MECGKPLAEARGEIASGAASVEWFAAECRRTTGDVLQTVSQGQRMVVLRQPVGVVRRSLCCAVLCVVVGGGEGGQAESSRMWRFCWTFGAHSRLAARARNTQHTLTHH